MTYMTRRVDELPTCDYCALDASFDGKTKAGPWANMCDRHFSHHGVGLGTGIGQELIEREPVIFHQATDQQRITEAMERGNIDQIMAIVGDGDLADFV